MRITIVLFLSVLLFACNSISNKERERIEFYLRQHDHNAKLNYNLAAGGEIGRFRIENLHLPPDELIKKTNDHMRGFKVQYFNTTDVSRDTSFTFKEYLSWCKATGSDPKEAYKYLD